MAEKRRVSCRDIPAERREYETIYILKPDVTNEVIGATNTKIRGVSRRAAAPCSRSKTGDAANWPTRLRSSSRASTSSFAISAAGSGRRGRAQPAPDRQRDSPVLGQDRRERGPRHARVEVTDELFANASVPGPDEEAIATGQAGARPFGDEDEEGAFDFEEAVFGKVDEPTRRGD